MKELPVKVSWLTREPAVEVKEAHGTILLRIEGQWVADIFHDANLVPGGAENILEYLVIGFVEGLRPLVGACKPREPS